MSIKVRCGAMFLVTAIIALPLAATAAESESRVRLVDVPDGGLPVAARADAAGTLHVLLDSPEGPRYARSSDGGKTFSDPIPVVVGGSRQPGLEYHGWDMAVGPDGRVHIALGTNAWKLKLPKEEWGFYYASLGPKEKSFAPVRNINRKPSEGFSLAADARGNVTACWLSGKLYASVSQDGGATFGDAVEVNPECDPCDCCTTSCVYAADGRLAVLYREETNNERDMYLLLWDQEQGRSQRKRISSTLWKIDACPMTYFCVTRRGDGFVAAWPTEGQVYFTRLDRWGERLSPKEIKTSGSTGMRTGLVALSAADGTTLVAWKHEKQLHWQLYDPRGNSLGPPQSVTGGGKGVGAAVDKDGNFVLFR